MTEKVAPPINGKTARRKFRRKRLAQRRQTLELLADRMYLLLGKVTQLEELPELSGPAKEVYRDYRVFIRERERAAMRAQQIHMESKGETFK